MNAAEKIVGQRFGKWTVLEAVDAELCGRMRHLARSRCDCGTERLAQPTELTAGMSTQCRTCSNRQKANMGQRLTHGGTSSRLYSIWTQMKARCQRAGSTSFHDYGARGIKICPEWQDFAVFRDWALGHGYADHLTIERRDNNGDYRPENCLWIPRPLQNRNRRDNKRVAWRGERLLVAEIAERTGLPLSMLRQRIHRRGWDVERAVTQPADNRGGHKPKKGMAK